VVEVRSTSLNHPGRPFCRSIAAASTFHISPMLPPWAIPFLQLKPARLASQMDGKKKKRGLATRPMMA